MEAKDLMIGDWVKVTHLNRIGKVFRIDQANGDGNGCVALIDGDFHESDLEPISLTPEILEKNGWRYDKSACTWVNDDIEIHLEDGFDGNGFWWKAGVNHITPINYVHQFQHVLKILGIKKEIIL